MEGKQKPRRRRVETSLRILVLKKIIYQKEQDTYEKLFENYSEKFDEETFNSDHLIEEDKCHEITSKKRKLD